MLIEELKIRFAEKKPSNLDAPETSVHHRELILSKPFLRKIYLDWYKKLIVTIDELPDGHIIEIGSGGGFLKDVFPEIITSDVIPLSHCDLCCAAHNLPYEDDSVAGLFMVDVLHHIPNSREFFAEAERVLMPGGRIVMIEPANTIFSRFIYKNFHHEDFDTKASDWHFDSIGALSGANGALPWIIFDRDREEFEERYTELKILNIDYHTPFRYLISGGLSFRFPIPGFLHGIVKWGEVLLEPFNHRIAMFQTIHVVKKGEFVRKPIEKSPILPENHGLFRSIAHVYYLAGQCMFKYPQRFHWAFRLFFWVPALLVFFPLMFTGLMFHSFVFLDYIGFYVARKRGVVLEKIRSLERHIEDSPKTFKDNPIQIALWMPVACITAIIPAVGGGIAAVTANFFDDLNQGPFSELRQTVKNIISLNWRALKHKPDLSDEERNAIYINIGTFIVVGAGVAILSIFDIISDLVVHTRKLMLNYIHNRAFGIQKSALGFIFNPILLLFLSPAIILLLIWPYLEAFLE